MYCIMTILLGLHGTGLLTCGIIAFRNTGVVSNGMPYFLGGFLVGVLVRFCLYLDISPTDKSKTN